MPKSQSQHSSFSLCIFTYTYERQDLCYPFGNQACMVCMYCQSLHKTTKLHWIFNFNYWYKNIINGKYLVVIREHDQPIYVTIAGARAFPMDRNTQE
jgi:hypothetical protein